MTSAINTSILLKAELLFAIVMSWVFFKEGLSPQKILAAFLVLIGSVVIVLDGRLELNAGDLLILAATALYPYGNYLAKKLLKSVSPPVIVFFRSFVGGIGILMISFAVEGTLPLAWQYITENIWLIMLNGIFLWGITKIMWLEGLKRLSITKATTLMLTEAAWGLLYAMVLLGEIPQIYQWLGFILVVLGVYISTRKKIFDKL